MKKYLWMSSAAVVIGALRIKAFKWEGGVLYLSYAECAHAMMGLY